MGLSAQIVRYVIKGRRRRFAALMAFALVGGLVELVGVTTIFPFLSLLGRPELAHTHPVLKRLYDAGGFVGDREFIFWVGVVAIVCFLVANAYVFAKNALVTRFAIGQMGPLSARLLRHYTGKPYPFFIENHSAQIAKDILIQSDLVANTVLLSWITALSESCTLLALTGLMLWVDVRTGLAIVLGLGSVVGGAYFVIQKQVYTLGQTSDEANGRRFAYCLEALGAIKEIKATESEDFFCRAFEPHAREMASAYSRTAVLQTAPSYFVQAVTASFIIGLGLYEIRRGMDLPKIVPLLSLYVVAGYRLLPSLLKFSGAVSQLRQHRHAFENVIGILSEEPPIRDAEPKPLPLGDGIELRRISFRYPGRSEDVFTDLDLHVRAGEFVALVGGSGAGKSTLVDLLLGLLTPRGGEILIGGAPLRPETLRAWRRTVSYVPQSVFLLDATVEENVAFGVDAGHIDQTRMRDAARQSQLDEFAAALPDGYRSRVGERGGRLSGGQRQRLGLARALYRDPSVLVLDESTSSLDGITEAGIVRTLGSLKGRKTIVVIAHRASTVRLCDRVVLLESGRVVDQGRYEELAARNPHFARLMSEPSGPTAAA